MLLSNLRNHKNLAVKCLIAIVLLSTTTLSVQAERLKDIADIAGVRDNPLIG